LLRRAEQAARSGRWVAVMVAYEAAPAFEPALRVRPGDSLPLAWSGCFDAPVAELSWTYGKYSVSGWTASVDRTHFDRDIDAIRAAIARGDVYQVNHTFRLRANFKGDPLCWFMRLRAAQPQGYCAYLDLGSYRILSASPELFFRREGDELCARPMKGTVRRGHNSEEDEELAQWLHRSPKNRAENAMIVDVIRNDLSRVALPGTVRVPALFTIERYPTVLQMTSTVTASARPGTTLEDIFCALFPCASISGAPKISSTGVIASLEDTWRGIYCGTVGLIAPGGDAIFNVAIRTVLLETASGEAICGVGGGITWDSLAAEEYEEALTKAAFLRAQETCQINGLSVYDV